MFGTKKKKNLSAVDDEFDLDFSFDDDGNFKGDDLPTISDDFPDGLSSREPVMSPTMDMARGLKDAVLSPTGMARVLKNVLPKQYGELFDDISMAKNEAGFSIAESMEGVNVVKRNMQNIIRKMIPLSQRNNLNGLTGVLNKMAGDAEAEFENAEASKEEKLTSEINATLTSLFAVQNKIAVAREALDEKKQQVRDVIETKRFESQYSVLGSVDATLKQQMAFDNRNTFNYFRKSIELAIRQLHSSRELYNEQQVSNKAVLKALNDIKLNSGLPDYVKMKNMEIGKQKMKERFFDGTTSYLSDMMKNLFEPLKSGIGTFNDFTSEMFNQVGDVLDAELDNDDPMMNEGKSDIRRLSGGATGSLLGGLGLWARKIINANARGTKYGDKILDGAVKLGRFKDNPMPYIIAAMASPWLKEKNLKWFGSLNKETGKKEESGLTNIFDWLFGYIGDSAKQTMQRARNLQLKSADGYSDFDTPEGTERLKNKSITRVIPGYLSLILREITMLRTGKPAELMEFNYRKGLFQTSSKLNKDLKASVIGTSNLANLRDEGDMVMSRLGIKHLNKFGRYVYKDGFTEKDGSDLVMGLFAAKLAGKNIDADFLMDKNNFPDFSEEKRKKLVRYFKKLNDDDYDTGTTNIQDIVQRVDSTVKNINPDMRTAKAIQAIYGDQKLYGLRLTDRYNQIDHTNFLRMVQKNDLKDIEQQLRHKEYMNRYGDNVDYLTPQRVNELGKSAKRYNYFLDEKGRYQNTELWERAMSVNGDGRYKYMPAVSGRSVFLQNTNKLSNTKGKRIRNTQYDYLSGLQPLSDVFLFNPDEYSTKKFVKEDFNLNISRGGTPIKDALYGSDYAYSGYGGNVQTNIDIVNEMVQSGKMKWVKQGNRMQLVSVVQEQPQATKNMSRKEKSKQRAKEKLKRKYPDNTEPETVEELKQVGSYSSGGYTGQGDKEELAGVVHRGEYVLNQENVEAMGGKSGIERLIAWFKNNYNQLTNSFSDTQNTINQSLGTAPTNNGKPLSTLEHIRQNAINTNILLEMLNQKLEYTNNLLTATAVKDVDGSNPTAKRWYQRLHEQFRGWRKNNKPGQPTESETNQDNPEKARFSLRRMAFNASWGLAKNMGLFTLWLTTLPLRIGWGITKWGFKKAFGIGKKPDEEKQSLYSRFMNFIGFGGDGNQEEGQEEGENKGKIQNTKDGLKLTWSNASQYMNDGKEYLLKSARDDLKNKIVDVYKRLPNGQVVNEPILKAKDFLEGKYRTAEGKVIKRWTDIRGNIYDEDGNIILTWDEFKDSVILFKEKAIQVKEAPWFGKISKFMPSKGTLAAAVIGGIAMGPLGLIAVPIAKKIWSSNRAKSFREKHRSIPDVYTAKQLVSDKTKPTLLAKDIKAGVYFDINSKKVIQDTTDITGPVCRIDDPNSLVLTQEEFDDGLYDINGKPANESKLRKGIMRRAGGAFLGLMGGALKNGAKALGYLGLGAAGIGLNMAIGLGKAVIGGIGGAASFGFGKLKSASKWLLEKVTGFGRSGVGRFNSILDKFNIKDAEGAFAASLALGNQTNMYLHNILRLLDKRMPKPSAGVLGDVDGDGLRENGYKDLRKKRLEELKRKEEEIRQNKRDTNLANKIADAINEKDKKEEKKKKGWLSSLFGGDDDEGGKSWRDRLEDWFDRDGDDKDDKKKKKDKKKKNGKKKRRWFGRRGGAAAAGAASQAGRSGGILSRTIGKVRGFGAGSAMGYLGALGVGYGAWEAVENYKENDYWGMAGNIGMMGLGAASLGWFGTGTGLAGIAGAGSAIGGFLVSNPIGWVILGTAAVGALGYGAYRLFRSKINDNVKARLMYYGFNPEKDENSASKILEFEEIIGKAVMVSGNRMAIDGKRLDLKKIMQLFKINQDDIEGQNNWVLWYRERFEPMFLRSLETIKAMKPKYDLSDIVDFKEGELLRYLNGIKGTISPSAQGAPSPFKEYPLTATVSEADAFLAGMINQLEKNPKVAQQAKLMGVRDSENAGMAEMAAMSKKRADELANPEYAKRLYKTTEEMIPGGTINGATKGTLMVGGTLVSSTMVKTNGQDKYDPFLNIKRKAYGLKNSLDIEKNMVIEAVEEVLKDMVQFRNGTAEFTGDINELMTKVIGYFGINQNDSNGTQALAYYLYNRFIPVYLEMSNACMNQLKSKDLTKIKEAKVADKTIIVSAMVNAKSAYGNSVWSEGVSPWGESYPLNINKTSIDLDMSTLQKEVATKTPSLAKTQAMEKASETISNQTLQSKQIQNNMSLFERMKASFAQNGFESVGANLKGAAQMVGDGVSAAMTSVTNFVTGGKTLPKNKQAFKDALWKEINNSDLKDNKNELAAFLAQIDIETGGLKWTREIDSGVKYNNRKDLGNTQPGDGPRYKGRGLIQTTGRANYEQLAAALGRPDIMSNPDLVSDDPEIAAKAAIIWWTKRKSVRENAKQGNIDKVSKLVNGGTNKIDERRQAYQQYLSGKGVLWQDGFKPSTSSSTGTTTVQDTANNVVNNAVSKGSSTNAYSTTNIPSSIAKPSTSSTKSSSKKTISDYANIGGSGKIDKSTANTTGKPMPGSSGGATSSGGTPWVDVARKYLGVGNKTHLSLIYQFHKASNNYTPKSTASEYFAWCSSFLNYVFKECGINGTGSPQARSYENWGSPAPTGTYPYGSVITWGIPGKKKPVPGSKPSNHVSLCVGVEGNKILSLGGNQSSKNFRDGREVTISRIPISWVTSVRLVPGASATASSASADAGIVSGATGAIADVNGSTGAATVAATPPKKVKESDIYTQEDIDKGQKYLEAMAKITAGVSFAQDEQIQNFKDKVSTGYVEANKLQTADKTNAYQSNLENSIKATKEQRDIYTAAKGSYAATVASSMKPTINENSQTAKVLREVSANNTSAIKSANEQTAEWNKALLTETIKQTKLLTEILAEVRAKRTNSKNDEKNVTKEKEDIQKQVNKEVKARPTSVSKPIVDLRKISYN